MHVTLCQEDFQERNVEEFISYLKNKHGGEHKDLRGISSGRRFDFDVCECFDAGVYISIADAEMQFAQEVAENDQEGFGWS